MQELTTAPATPSPQASLPSIEAIVMDETKARVRTP